MKRQLLRRAPVAAALALATGGCLGGTSGPPPGFAPALPPQPPTARNDGAIFDAGAGYAALIQGGGARRVGDLVTIVIVERTTSTKSVGGRTDRDGSLTVLPPSSGLLSFLNPNSLNSSAGSSFNGQGDADQSSTLNSELTVTIAEVRPNGTAVVRGEKRMVLSQGQEWVQFAGIVRLADIDANNRVPSTRIADVRLEYSGDGPIHRAARPGWLSRLFGSVSPF